MLLLNGLYFLTISKLTILEIFILNLVFDFWSKLASPINQPFTFSEKCSFCLKKRSSLLLSHTFFYVAMEMTKMSFKKKLPKFP